MINDCIPFPHPYLYFGRVHAYSNCLDMIYRKFTAVQKEWIYYNNLIISWLANPSITYEFVMWSNMRSEYGLEKSFVFLLYYD